MEMNFPHLRSQNAPSQSPANLQAILAVAISRQSLGITAKQMLLLYNKAMSEQIDLADPIDLRINYFAKRSQNLGCKNQVSGAFADIKGKIASEKSIYDQAVYHSALADGKDSILQIDTSPTQAAQSGQEKLRNI
jgi:hypothetical protein